MTKYKQYFQEMLEMHNEQLLEFKKIHDEYAEDPKKYKKEFDEKGQDVKLLIQRYVNRLCMKMESGRYGKFSSTLSDKFWEQVRTYFPQIDMVGME